MPCNELLVMVKGTLEISAVEVHMPRLVRCMAMGSLH